MDLSGVKLIIANSAYIVDKDLKKLDLYYNGAKVGKLDFEYENNAFTFENVEKTKFEQNKFNRNEDYKMTIKVAKLGIEVEIPYVIEA